MKKVRCGKVHEETIEEDIAANNAGGPGIAFPVPTLALATGNKHGEKVRNLLLRQPNLPLDRFLQKVSELGQYDLGALTNTLLSANSLAKRDHRTYYVFSSRGGYLVSPSLSEARETLSGYLEIRGDGRGIPWVYNFKDKASGFIWMSMQPRPIV